MIYFSFFFFFNYRRENCGKGGWEGTDRGEKGRRRRRGRGGKGKRIRRRRRRRGIIINEEGVIKGGMISKYATSRRESGVPLINDLTELRRTITVRDRNKIRRIINRPLSRKSSMTEWRDRHRRSMNTSAIWPKRYTSELKSDF